MKEVPLAGMIPMMNKNKKWLLVELISLRSLENLEIKIRYS